MALREEMEKSGGWLFRWRSYLPLLLAVLLIPSLTHFAYPDDSHRLDLYWEMLCLLVSFAGLGVRILTVGFAPEGTSGRNTTQQKASELNTSGMYSVVRHPLYLGNFLIWFGISMFPRLWWISLLFILIFWLYYERIMLAEEVFLREKFGQRFEEWAGRTPAFIPKLRDWQKPHLSFSLKTVLKREYSGFYAVVVVFSTLEFVGDLFAQDEFQLDLVWVAILLASTLLYIILRTMKKKTRLLDHEGR
jgi:protein-S-isoprenylcysteine O-methyltransferase Ste14